MKKKMSNRDKTFWAVVIPVVILFFAFNTLPMIKGVIYSFTNYKGYGTYDYVGFRNYADLFTDSRVGKSYLFTFKYALAGTILVNVLSLIMAVGLNSAIRFKSALRGIYFVPNILGGLVIGYIFSFIFTYILPTVGNVFHIGFLQNSILASEKYGNRPQNQNNRKYPVCFLFFFHHNCSSFLFMTVIWKSEIATITIKKITAFALWNPNCPPSIPFL
jgi:raffinose/stachyose/melibiose transport system permease protein